MSTDKIFLGCREHEINLQDLGRTPSGPPGGGRRGGVGASVRGVGGELQSTTNMFQSWKTIFYSGFVLLSLHSPCHITDTGLPTGKASEPEFEDWNPADAT